MDVCGSLVRSSLSLAHVRNEEDDTEGDTEGAHNNVADGEEVVGASENIRGREHEVLAAVEWINFVSVLYIESVGAFGQIFLNFTVQFAEVGKTSRSHPDNEVFYDKREVTK